MNDAKQATPAAELERQICSATEPKNEREWWAHREVERLRADAERYRWLADKVLACDYGDNDKGCVGWHIRHCKGPAWIAGDSIDAAIDAAIARGKE